MLRLVYETSLPTQLVYTSIACHLTVKYFYVHLLQYPGMELIMFRGLAVGGVTVKYLVALFLFELASIFSKNRGVECEWYTLGYVSGVLHRTEESVTQFGLFIPFWMNAETRCALVEWEGGCLYAPNEVMNGRTMKSSPALAAIISVH